eukprot:COSAG05_NODE_1189_length_5574_cov_2572.551963_2_plen_78_part_00
MKDTFYPADEFLERATAGEFAGFHISFKVVCLVNTIRQIKTAIQVFQGFYPDETITLHDTVEMDIGGVVTIRLGEKK